MSTLTQMQRWHGVQAHTQRKFCLQVCVPADALPILPAKNTPPKLSSKAETNAHPDKTEALGIAVFGTASTGCLPFLLQPHDQLAVSHWELH